MQYCVRGLFVVATIGFLGGCSGSSVSVTTLAGAKEKIVSGRSEAQKDGVGTEARFRYISALAVDDRGTLYALDSGTVRKIDSDGRVTTVLRARVKEDDMPLYDSLAGLAVDSHGNIFVSDRDSNRHYGPAILKMTPDGRLFVFATGSRYRGKTPRLPCRMTGSSTPYLHMFGPSSLAMDGKGNLYFEDGGCMDNLGVFKVTPEGDGSVVAGFDKQTLSDSAGVEATVDRFAGADREGNVYVYCRLCRRGENGVILDNSLVLRKISPEGVVTTVGGGPLGADTSHIGRRRSEADFIANQRLSLAAVDNKGNLFVADWGNNIITKIAPNGTVTTVAGVPGAEGYKDGSGRRAQFIAPTAIAVDMNGTLYVADSTIIRKITLR